jgi:lipid A 3-O-deacylase
MNFLAMIVAGLGLLFPIGAFAQGKIVDEVRVAVYQHDTPIIGSHRESGADFGFEALSTPLWSQSAPRFVLGGIVNTAGKTDQIYAGFAGTYDFLHRIFTGDDAVFIEGMVGGAVHDGKLDVRGTPAAQEWKSHGSRFVFHVGFDFGYRFNPTWSLALTFFHISNANIAQPNQGSNDIGLRLGMRL